MIGEQVETPEGGDNEELQRIIKRTLAGGMDLAQDAVLAADEVCMCCMCVCVLCCMGVLYVFVLYVRMYIVLCVRVNVLYVLVYVLYVRV